jgi:hypothetical protein
LSFQQIVLLVVVPGVVFPATFNYLLSMMVRPLNSPTFVNDKFLVTVTLLSLLFTYGGIVIHAVTKTLSEYIDRSNEKAWELNEYFHNQFSHTLTFSGVPLTVVGVTLLELNHIPNSQPVSLVGGVVKGLLMGLAYTLGIQFYAKYVGWSKLKVVFVVLWIGFVALLYGYRKIDPTITDYQLLLPTLLSFGLMVFLSFVLIIKRVGRGYKVYLSRKKMEKMVLMMEDE